MDVFDRHFGRLSQSFETYEDSQIVDDTRQILSSEGLDLSLRVLTAARLLRYAGLDSDTYQRTLDFIIDKMSECSPESSNLKKIFLSEGLSTVNVDVYLCAINEKAQALFFERLLVELCRSLPQLIKKSWECNISLWDSLLKLKTIIQDGFESFSNISSKNAGVLLRSARFLHLFAICCSRPTDDFESQMALGENYFSHLSSKAESSVSISLADFPKKHPQLKLQVVREEGIKTMDHLVGRIWLGGASPKIYASNHDSKNNEGTKSEKDSVISDHQSDLNTNDLSKSIDERVLASNLKEDISKNLNRVSSVDSCGDFVKEFPPPTALLGLVSLLGQVVRSRPSFLSKIVPSFIGLYEAAIIITDDFESKNTHNFLTSWPSSDRKFLIRILARQLSGLMEVPEVERYAPLITEALRRVQSDKESPEIDEDDRILDEIGVIKEKPLDISLAPGVIDVSKIALIPACEILYRTLLTLDLGNLKAGLQVWRPSASSDTISIDQKPETAPLLDPRSQENSEVSVSENFVEKSQKTIPIEESFELFPRILVGEEKQMVIDANYKALLALNGGDYKMGESVRKRQKLSHIVRLGSILDMLSNNRRAGANLVDYCFQDLSERVSLLTYWLRLVWVRDVFNKLYSNFPIADGHKLDVVIKSEPKEQEEQSSKTENNMMDHKVENENYDENESFNFTLENGPSSKDVQSDLIVSDQNDAEKKLDRLEKDTRGDSKPHEYDEAYGQVMQRMGGMIGEEVPQWDSSLTSILCEAPDLLGDLHESILFDALNAPSSRLQTLSVLDIFIRKRPVCRPSILHEICIPLAVSEDPSTRRAIVSFLVDSFTGLESTLDDAIIMFAIASIRSITQSLNDGENITEETTKFIPNETGLSDEKDQTECSKTETDGKVLEAKIDLPLRLSLSFPEKILFVFLQSINNTALASLTDYALSQVSSMTSFISDPFKYLRLIYLFNPEDELLSKRGNALLFLRRLLEALLRPFKPDILINNQEVYKNLDLYEDDPVKSINFSNSSENHILSARNPSSSNKQESFENSVDLKNDAQQPKSPSTHLKALHLIFDKIKLGHWHASLLEILVPFTRKTDLISTSLMFKSPFYSPEIHEGSSHSKKISRDEVGVGKNLRNEKYSEEKSSRSRATTKSLYEKDVDKDSRNGKYSGKRSLPESYSEKKIVDEKSASKRRSLSEKSSSKRSSGEKVSDNKSKSEINSKKISESEKSITKKTEALKSGEKIGKFSDKKQEIKTGGEPSNEKTSHSNTLKVKSLLDRYLEAVEPAKDKPEVVLCYSKIANQLGSIDLLIHLHNAENAVPLKRCLEATQLCISMASVFHPDILSAAIQRMSSIPNKPLPTILMRTVIEAVSIHRRAIGPFVANLLRQLASSPTRRIWADPKTWEGFVRLVRLMTPVSFSAIILLPVEQVRKIIEIAPEIKTDLSTYVSKQGPIINDRFASILAESPA